MNGAAWERAKSLLAEAADLPAEARARFVVEHCPDPEVRREVLDMLASPAPLSEIIMAGALAPGDRLGPYLVERLVGRGGMGLVYRARDTRLDRTVAIKVLPPELSADPARRERFNREARAIAALADPHICALYDINHDHGVDYLVMQFLEGETLAERLARGRLPLDEVLRLAVDIASALDHAHRIGVVHRDLKPANIMLTRAGAVLLDFGLARLTRSVAGTASTATTAPATLTAEGTLIGTLHYMSPEQLEGREADARSDIFAFGAVAYEMATGQKAFDGDSQASVLGAVLKDPPPSITQHEPMAPPELDRLVRTCLAKNPDDRLQSFRDVVIALRWVRDADARPTPLHLTDGTRRRHQRWFAGAAVGVIVAAIAALGYLVGVRSSVPDTPSPVRFDLQPPPGWRFNGVTISPDGRHVVSLATNDNGVQQLWLRTLSEGDGRFLRGTDSAADPFWAPDSRTIGFFANGKLKRLDILDQSTPLTVCDAANPRGGAWVSDSDIVFSTGILSGLVRVPASGGDPVSLTTPARDRGEIDYRFPSPIPNRRLLYYVRNQKPDENAIWLISLDDPQHPSRLVRSHDSGVFGAGFLFWTTPARAVVRQPLDLSTGRLFGNAETVIARVDSGGLLGRAAFDVSAAGSLVFRTWSPPVTQLAWVTRNGEVREPLSDVGNNREPKLSPDGRRVVYVRAEADRSELWVADVGRSPGMRILSEQTYSPIVYLGWSPDGRRIGYSSPRGPGGVANVYVVSAAGGEAAPLVEGPGGMWFSGWTPDGRTAVWLQYSNVPQVTGEVANRFAITLMGPDRKPLTYFDPGYWVQHPTMSPDGRWIAFTSNQSRRREVFVIGFPEPGTPRQVSLAGGTQPRWRGDGRELYFLSPESKLMAVAVKTVKGDVIFGRPEPLFDAPMRWFLQAGLEAISTQYDVSPDGTRFLINVVHEERPAPLTVILNSPKLTGRP